MSITPAVNTLLVAFASVSANTQTAPTMTDNQGGTYTLVGQAYWLSSADNMFAFVRNTLVTTSTATVITLDTNTNTAAEIEVVAFAGMTRTGAAAVKQFTSHGNNTAVTVPVLTFSSNVTTTDATIVAVASGDNNAAPPSGWNERKDASQSSPVTCLETATRNSGFTGTTITYGGTQDTSYAEMALELDNSVSSPPVDAGVDSMVADASVVDAAPDATPADASLVDAGSSTFAHGSVSQIYGTGQNPAQVTLDTSASGSTFIVAPGGKTSDVNRGPTDNKGNTYTKVGGIDYADYPGYGAYVWASKNAIGGTGQTWSQYVTRFDEDTTFVIEVPNAGTNPTIISSVMQHDNSGSYEPWLPGEITLTSNSVTTTGPATLIAYWWGSGPTSWGDHIATPNNGFTNLN